MSNFRKIGISRAPGGLPGLDAHVGAWLAFEAAGIEPTRVMGCSAGAMVSAMQAAGKTALEAQRILKGLATKDVVKKRWCWKTRACFGMPDIADPAPIVALLEELLPPHFDDLEIPLLVSATCMDDVQARDFKFCTGSSLRQTVQASMSIAGVWPSVQVGDLTFSDGGTTDAIVLPADIETYHDFYIINLTRKEDFGRRDRNAWSRLMWNVDMLTRYERREEQRDVRGMTNVHWLDIDLGKGSTLKFDHGLIAAAEIQTAEWLRKLQAAKRG